VQPTSGHRAEPIEDGIGEPTQFGGQTSVEFAPALDIWFADGGQERGLSIKTP